MRSKPWQWNNLGRIFLPEPQGDWGVSHAQIPTAYPVSGHQWRIFYATRGTDGRSRTTFVDVDATDPGRILRRSPRPVLEPGPLGAFDHAGIMPSWIVERDDGLYMYTIGWTVREDVPYHNTVGLARSLDGGNTWSKMFPGPVLGTCAEEPFFTGTSCVLKVGQEWRNWYMNCTEWNQVAGSIEPRYHLCQTRSPDGVNWQRPGRVAVDYSGDEEGGISRASVLPDTDGKGYHMWYSYRAKEGYRDQKGRGYQIGYAWSPDGNVWTRADHLSGLAPSTEGWDDIMQAYPHVFRHRGQLHMLYNGNGFGMEGFGYAIMEDD